MNMVRAIDRECAALVLKHSVEQDINWNFVDADLTMWNQELPEQCRYKDQQVVDALETAALHCLMESV